MHPASRSLALFTFALSASVMARAQGPVPAVSMDPHNTEEWRIIAPHLPDPVSGAPEKLETAGDVLRARRFPEDAITFYKAAIINGGDRSRLLKKEGVVHLEMQHGLIARLCFQQAVKLDKKDAEAWNNLGAADFMLGNPRSSVSEYKRAVKLKKNSAVFHSNLALAYFEARDTHTARQEWQKAFALDPDLLHRNESGGYNLQVLASTHYAEICFEMARMYASQNDVENTIVWLTKASERGFDVRSAMKGDAQMSRYLTDERVKILLANNEHLKKEFSGKPKPPGLSSAQ